MGEHRGQFTDPFGRQRIVNFLKSSETRKSASATEIAGMANLIFTEVDFGQVQTPDALPCSGSGIKRIWLHANRPPATKAEDPLDRLKPFVTAVR